MTHRAMSYAVRSLILFQGLHRLSVCLDFGSSLELAIRFPTLLCQNILRRPPIDGGGVCPFVPRCRRVLQ